MSKTKIEWTEVTWNPVLGCAKVSEGCRNCYAMSMSARIANAAAVKDEQSPVEKGYMDIVKQDENGKYLPKWTGSVALIEERLYDPLKWQKPRKVFVNSMSDLFHPDVPFDFIDKVFSTMIASPKHTFQVLTKRPERMAEYLKRVVESALDSDIDMAVFDTWRGIYGGEYGEIPWPAPNVWLGTSVENQEAADKRIPHLLKCPAAVRFLSCEPLLGPVDFSKYPPFCYEPVDTSTRNHLKEVYGDRLPGNSLNVQLAKIKIDWVIVGGESGHNARPMHPDWVNSLRVQCKNAGVPFFFKQWGKFSPEMTFGVYDQFIVTPNGSHWDIKEHPDKNIPAGSALMWKTGKKKAGRIIGGREYNEFPTSKEAEVQ